MNFELHPAAAFVKHVVLAHAHVVGPFGRTFRRQLVIQPAVVLGAADQGLPGFAGVPKAFLWR